MKATTYEFVVEELDFYEGCRNDPDITDTSGFDTLAEAVAFAGQCDKMWRIALRRDSGSDHEGITARFYAYPDTSGHLPERMETATGFEDGPDVPKRFRELTIPFDRRVGL